MPLLLRFITERLQALTRRVKGEDAAHMDTARRGELQAYLYLREQGYRMVERNLRQRGHHGEVDLIGWDNGVLCFVEVKTRTGEGLTAPEAAVDRNKKQYLRAVARRYVTRLNTERVHPARFDIVSVIYPESGGEPALRLIKDAFRWSVKGWRRGIESQ